MASATESPQALATPPVVKISLYHRLVASTGASLVSAFVVNPMDVVKTRIQIQTSPTHTVSQYAQEHALLERWSFAACEPAMEARAAAAVTPAQFKGTLDALWRIGRHEGMQALWRGTSVSLAMTVPMVGIYLPLYDAFLEMGKGAAWAPVVAGTLSRTVAVLATAPFELVRTRLQARSTSATPSPAPCVDCDCPLGSERGRGSVSAAGEVSAASQAPVKRGLAGVRGLWRGVGSQLARDVPFSALYWALVEPIRAAMMAGQTDDPWTVFRVNTTTGLVAGGFAGAITTPLDVVKTRLQVGGQAGHPAKKSPTMTAVIAEIWAAEGAGGMFRGWSARASKVGPSCAIVLSAYEGIKHWHALG